MNKAKRGFLIGVILLIAYLLQTVIFTNVMHITPNIILILVVYFGIMNDSITGIVVGFAAGLLLDCTGGPVFGLYSLLYMFIGYISSLYHRNFYGKSLVLPSVLLIIMDILYGVVLYLIYFNKHHGIDITPYVKTIMIPEMIYTLILGILLYKIVYTLNKRTL